MDRSFLFTPRGSPRVYKTQGNTLYAPYSIPPTLLCSDGCLKKFTSQGVEKNNDAAKQVLFHKSNKWDVAKDILCTESRQWDLAKCRHFFLGPETDEQMKLVKNKICVNL